MLERSLRSSAGRRHESDEERAALIGNVDRSVRAAADEQDILRALCSLTMPGRPSALVEPLRGDGMLGRGRAAELGWNAALPLLIAAAAAYGDVPLTRATAALADRWPAPRPYGRTATLRALLKPTEAPAAPAADRRPRRGALYDQGLLHLQDLWCERGGCGVCPLSTHGARRSRAVGRVRRRSRELRSGTQPSPGVSEAEVSASRSA